MGLLIKRFHMPRGRATKGALGISAGIAAGQVLFLLASPLLTRLYGPDAFGLFTVLTSGISTLAVMASLRLELAVPLPRSDRKARQVVSTAVVAAGTICGLAGLLVAIGGPSIAGALPGVDIGPWLWVVPVSAFFFAIYDVVSQYAVRHHRYGMLGRRSFVQNALMALAQLGLGAFAVKGGLPLGQLVAKAVVVVAMLRATGLGTKAVVADVSLRSMRETLRRHRRFPTLVMPSAFLNTLGTQGPFLLVGFLFGAPIVGLLGLTQRVLAAPASLLGQAISSVFLGESASVLRGKVGSSYGIFLRASGLLAAVGAVFFTVVFLTAPFLFGLVFGEQWVSAGMYAQAMCISVAFQFVVVPVSQTLILNGALGTQLAWDAARLTLVIGSILLAFVVGLDALTAVWIYSACSAMAYIALWLLCLRRVAATREAVIRIGR